MSGVSIIGGEAKGRSLKSPPPGALSIRPLLAQIKKSLFDILAPHLCDAAFLDLFAGTGAVGLEALSRGAARAVFVEQDGHALRLIRENIDLLGWANRATVIRGDATRDLGAISGPFDIVFAGPPYRDGTGRPLSLTSAALRGIAAGGILAPEGMLISQRHENEQVMPVAGLTETRRKSYGETLLVFYRRDA